ncbi:MAG TPA: glycosyltransferase family 39 protein [Luteibaculaceae bacterium]|nr:glycosyltransferase family 39 protein [Luteibaculaceae bacterium]
MKTNSYKSIGIICLAGLISLLMSFSQHRWTRLQIIQQDARIYYEILPATFVHGDPTFQFLEQPNFTQRHEYWLESDSSHNGRFMKYTIGVGLVQAPVYLLVNGVCELVGIDHPPFGKADHFAVFLATWLAYLGALIGSFRVLRHYFSDGVTSLVLLAVFLATNVFHYTCFSPGYGHIYSLLALSWLWYVSIRLQETQRPRLFFALGLIFGLIILIRPTNAVMALIPLAVIAGKRERGSLVSFWRQHLSGISLALAGVFCIVFPQLLLWKFSTGSWLVYSYGKESFFWSKPHLIEGLFSFRNGWLSYAPVMIGLFPGLILLRKADKMLFWALLLFLLVNNYVIYSWWCWWYGGAYGSRPQVDSALITGFLLGVALNHVWNHRQIRSICALLVVCFASINLFQSYQASIGILHWDSMTAKSYRDIFLTLKPNEWYEYHLKQPDYENAVRGREYPVLVDQEITPKAGLLDTTNTFSPGIELDLDSIQAQQVSTFYLSGVFQWKEIPTRDVFMVFNTLDSAGNSISYQSWSMHNPNFEVNRRYVIKKQVNWDKTIHPVGSKLRVYVWNPDKCQFFMDAYRLSNF